MVITINELKEIFESMFEEELNTNSLTESTRLVDDMGMNSISMLYMSLTLEERYNVKFDNSDFNTLKTVGDVLALINKA